MTVEYHIRYNNFGALARALPGVASRIVRETGLGMVADISAGMSGPHSGEVYGGHVASAPGEMPAVDTGNLLGSLAMEGEPGDTRVTVYVTPESGAYLEVGAPNAGIEPRPFMAPAAARAAPEFVRRLGELEQELGRGTAHG